MRNALCHGALLPAPRAPRDELVALQKFSCVLPFHTRGACGQGLGWVRVGPWCCQSYFGQFKLLYPFTSSHCGIFSSCDNVPMMLRRVFGDFDVRAIRELLVPGQGVAIRARAQTHGHTHPHIQTRMHPRTHTHVYSQRHFSIKFILVHYI